MKEKDIISLYDGEILSEGMVEGQVYIFDVDILSDLNKAPVKCDDILFEIERFNKKVVEICIELENYIDNLRDKDYFKEADILETHLYILKSDDLQKKVHEKIHSHCLVAESAVEHVFNDIIDILKKSDNIVFREKTLDFKDIIMRFSGKTNDKIKNNLIRNLQNLINPIVIINELYPSIILESNKSGIGGFIVKNGSPYSHAVILAKSFGIPIIKIENITEIKLNNLDKVIIDSENETLSLLSNEYKLSSDINKQTTLKKIKKNHLPIKLWLNIIDPGQIVENTMNNIEGIGLYRTEFLFMNKNDFPIEDEQIFIYKELFKKCKNKPITIRTLDIGGDKLLPYFFLGPQENPNLGIRAHRIFRYHPEIFITQMRAILRSASGYKNELRIMYPFIETLEELNFIKSLEKKAVKSLQLENTEYIKTFKTGIMIEVPSVIWNLDEILDEVDFVSIGSNDLIQYLYAVDRNNANINEYFFSENPVTLKMFKYILKKCKEKNKHVSICGELASDIRYLPILAGLGFENISIDFHSVEKIINLLLELDLNKCKIVFNNNSKLSNHKKIKKALNEFNTIKNHKYKIKKAVSNFIDPICKMTVNPLNTKFHTEYKGIKYHFCCESCLKKFLTARRNK